MPNLLWTGNERSATRLLLAHGAGAPMTSPFLETLSAQLSGRGLLVARFEFDYMAQRRSGAAKRPPPRAERLMEEYCSAVTAARLKLKAGQRLIIGGKSMGGRVASLCADALFEAGQIAGLVCLGYPFHAPGKTAYRTQHLLELKTPTLIVQGERDPFGTREEVEALQLSPSIEIAWATDGDHDFKPRRASGVTWEKNLSAAADRAAKFATALERT